MKKIYLDTCICCRPFDEPSARVDVERKAFLGILRRVYEKKFSVVGSIFLEIEVEKIKGEAQRRAIKDSALRVVSEKVGVSQKILSRKREVQRLGLRDMDAYHLACAVESGAQYFISVDDEILTKGRQIESQYQIKVCNPMDFLRREGNGD